MFTVLIGISLIFAFASCENDRDRDFTEPKLDLEDISKTYSGSNLIINAELAAQLQKVEVESVSEEEVTFKLTNIIEGLAETSFTVPVTKKESGAYAFDYMSDAKNPIVSEDGVEFKIFKFSGAFVGNTSEGENVKLVVSCQEVYWTTIEDLLEFETEQVILATITGSKFGWYNIYNLEVNGDSGDNKDVRVELTKGTSSDKVNMAFKSLVFGAGSKTFKDIELKRGEKFNTWVFDEIIYENYYNTISVKGYFEGYKLYLNVSRNAQSDFVGKWEMVTDSGLASFFDVQLKTKSGGDDQIHSDNLTNFYRRSLPIVMPQLSINLQKDGSAKIRYMTDKGEFESQVLWEYYISTAGIVKLGIRDSDIQKLALELNEIGFNLTTNDISEIFISSTSSLGTSYYSEGRFNYFQFLIGEDNLGQKCIKFTHLKQINNITNFLVKITPKTESEYQKLGLDFVKKSDIEDLLKAYNYMPNITTGTSIDLGFRKK